ncbi:MAG: AAA domain-containing protein [Bernardetiaceae bacterium]|nr:AAA domain-containing protein [Bernardetiaceae bacterium]
MAKFAAKPAFDLAKFLKIYRQRLTNLSATNRSLLLLRLSQRQFLDFHELDFLLNRPSFALVADLLARKRRVALCRRADSRDQATNRASLLLKNLYRTDQTVQQERGANDLCLGFPFVQGRLHDDTPIRCPLLFFPVELREEGADWVLRWRTDEDIVLNKTFLLAYAHFNQVKLAEDFYDFSFEEFSQDPQIFLTELYRWLEEGPLEINFNQASFAERLETFGPLKKADFEAATRTGELKLLPQAVLGLFPQADSYLVPDYDTLIDQAQVKDVEAFFGPAKTVDGKLQNLDLQINNISETNTVSPYPLDASQERVMQAVKAGQSLVVQGPPGTGKSQLICNLIADHLAAGKRVLVVCQKRAALDVVYARLHEKSLANFAALVHDFQHDRARIYAQIGQQIDTVYQKNEQKIDLGSLYQEEKFIQACRQIEGFNRQLDQFRTALFDTSLCGLSAKELYLTSSPARPHLDLGGLHGHFPFGSLAEFMPKLRAYGQYHARLAGSPWAANRASFAGFGFPDLAKLQALLGGFAQQVAQCQQAARPHLAKLEPSEASRLQIADFEAILACQLQIDQVLAYVDDDQVFRYFLRILPYDEVDWGWFDRAEEALMACFADEGPETTLAYDEIATYRGFLEEFLTAQAGLLQKMWWQWFGEHQKEVNQLFARNQLEPNEANARVLLAKLARRERLEQQRLSMLSVEWLSDAEQPEFDSKANALDWVLQLPTAPDRAAYLRWFAQFRMALQAHRLWLALAHGQTAKRRRSPAQAPVLAWVEVIAPDQLARDLAGLQQAAGQFQATRQSWKPYLSDFQITQMWQEAAVGHNQQAAALLAHLPAQFELLCELDTLRASLTPPQRQVVELLLAAEPPPADLTELFDNSLRLAWLAELEQAQPGLRQASSLGLAQAEAGLQAAVADKQALSQAVATGRAWERLLRELEYNRLRNLISFRDLRHQVNKKRGVWPLRKLVAHFADELFRLVPCWLVSPESGSAVFPMTELFDLVVFDEASQCFAERGIPAMYRGRQVVIAGDDQQLAPFDLYRPRWEDLTDEPDYAPELEVESLLDLGRRFLPNLPLTGHYRSRSLDLIGFSNQHFYQNQLQMLPHYQDFIRQQPAIEYRKVDGQWEQNRNQREAEEIVALVRQLLAQQPDKQIGVITFNAPQQDLVRDLLDESGLALPEHLFVKNIENVQGDERDIILFSVGYAPSPSGRLLLQFGSLSQARGENRLNVAVTRARERVVVVSSLLPHQLAVDDTANPGPKMLRAYLQYALDVWEGRFRPALPNPAQLAAGQYLKHQLLAKGPGHLTADLPFADLAQWQQGQLARLILTDDDLFYQALSAKDAFAYRPAHFAAKQWPFVRAFSRPWWAAPDQEASRLELSPE